jgi:hypothetical protein
MVEPQYSVLVFSKFSPNCKKLIDTITSSGINMGLQSLCIDNEKVRQRIRENQQFNLTVVPCILSIYANGSVETYEGPNAFNWVENILARFAPPPPPVQLPPPPPPQPVLQRQQRRQLPPETEEEYGEDPIRRGVMVEHRGGGSEDPTGLGDDPEDSHQRLSSKEEAELMKSVAFRGDRNRGKTEETKVKTRPKMVTREDIPRRMRRIEPDDEEEPSGISATSIDSIPYEDEEESDRHRTVQQPRRIRKDENQFEEDEELFSGEVVDNRKQPGNTVKAKAQKSTRDINNIRAKADALALDREALEKQINAPIKRSDSEHRRP